MYIFIILPLFIISLAFSTFGIFSSFLAGDDHVDFENNKVSSVAVVDASSKDGGV